MMPLSLLPKEQNPLNPIPWKTYKIVFSGLRIAQNTDFSPNQNRPSRKSRMVPPRGNILNS